MAKEYYYAEDGTRVGPFPSEEILRRISLAKERRHLVWSEGMPQWADARSLPEFAEALPKEAPKREAAAPENKPAEKPTIAHRVRHEIESYLTVSGYLLVWFTALLFYKSTILGSAGIEFAPLGIAVVKALILGKFILVLEMMKVGERNSHGTGLAFAIVRKSLLFTLLLIIMLIVEEVVVGHFHGHEVSEVLGEMGGGTLPQAIAMSLLMFLVLIPYFAFRQLQQEKESE